MLQWWLYTESTHLCYPNNTETITLFYENEIFYKNDYN